jgi:hypothetical protein
MFEQVNGTMRSVGFTVDEFENYHTRDVDARDR